VAKPEGTEEHHLLGLPQEQEVLAIQMHFTFIPQMAETWGKKNIHTSYYSPKRAVCKTGSEQVLF
jgi:hypothetical protein